jgi:AraC-like DNA-binding protein
LLKQYGKNMIYKELSVPKPYCSIIECIWIYENSENKNVDSKHFWIPNGTFDIVFNLGSPYIRVDIKDPNKVSIVNQDSLIGQMKIASRIELGMVQKTIGIRFKPYGLYACLGLSCDELTEKTVSLNDLSIPRLNNCWKLLKNALDEVEIKNVLLSIFEIRYNIDSSVCDAVEKILKSKGNLSVKELVKNYGISQRSLELKFQKFIGLTPKELLKIYRLNNFLVRFSSHPSEKLTSLAYEIGYYDQAHLNHDFLNTTGLAPKTFMKKQSNLLTINKYSMERRFSEFYF